MNPRKVYNIVKPREYINAQGEHKTSWSRHGILIIDGDKVSIRMDSIPAGDWNGWLNCFEKEEMHQPASAANNGYQFQQAAGAEFDNDIPF